MTIPTPEQIQQLKELLERVANAETQLWYVGDDGEIFGDTPEGLVATATSEDYAELIVSLRNLAPALLEDYERLLRIAHGFYECAHDELHHIGTKVDRKTRLQRAYFAFEERALAARKERE